MNPLNRSVWIIFLLALLSTLPTAAQETEQPPFFVPEPIAGQAAAHSSNDSAASAPALGSSEAGVVPSAASELADEAEPHERGHADDHGAEHGGGVTDELYRAVNFLILAVFVFWVIGRKIPGLLRKRHEDIKATIAGVEQRQRDLQHKLDTATGRQDQMAVHVSELLANAEHSAKLRGQEIIHNAHAEADRIKRQMDKQKTLAEKRLEADLAQFLLAQSMSFAETELRKTLNDADHQNMADAYIQHVGKVRL